ncbi:hypothetical protein LOOC260_102940 [Paucilactobacillus hokkaidonensis JCM 18461]|uniref:Uncharacterized protein n=1 Tax=Paucilactobacillus hokkaidonensis JCM 18461 TaxID=1291742 RepID=A0A0A1GRD9_9LACO|nr:putative metal homeostasis protein [Paucilactobacillus hokkaidonensis]BAP84872.1 hypothetical protein LOOC260_102940 [Paucilactobacillus hokkaidonensis JCM 18461]
MAEKIDYASAKRRLNSRNIKTRNRAKKVLHDMKRNNVKKVLVNG